MKKSGIREPQQQQNPKLKHPPTDTAKPETPAAKPETPAAKPETPATDTAAQPQSQQGSGATGQEFTDTSKSLQGGSNPAGGAEIVAGQSSPVDLNKKAQQQAANAWQEEGRTLSYRGLRNIRLRRL